MNGASLLRLLALSAIWGGSFLLMRIAVPVVGPIVLIESRVALAALFLLLVAVWLKRSLDLSRNWRHYLFLGLFNSALPFLFYGYAAQTLPAGLMSILNATAPIWGAVLGAIWHRQGLSAKTSLGLLLGIIGVALLVGFDEVSLQPGATPAIIAVLMATCCYGISSVYAHSARSVEPFANAHGNMWAATLWILPALPFFPAPAPVGFDIAIALLILGVVCSGIAYLLYFRLIADIGAAPALTVTFLIPVFGVLWGYLLLDETVGWHTLVGSLIVITGTALVTGFSPSSLWRRAATEQASSQ